MSRNNRLRTTAALAASVLLHLTCAVLLLRARGRRAPATVASPLRPIEVSLTESDRLSSAADAIESPPPPRRRSKEHERAALPGRSESEPRPSAAPPAERAPSAPEPKVSPPIGRAPDLSFDALADRTKHRLDDRPDPAEALEQLLAPGPDARGPRSVAELRAEADRRARAEANVRAGRADPLLFDVLRDAQRLLTPEATRLAEALPLGPAETTRGWARGYLGRVAEAQRGAFAPVRPADEPFGGPRPDVLGAYDEAQQQAEKGAEQRTAEVCLGIAPDHAVVAMLRRSSGNAALDRLAIDSFRSAGAGRPADARVPPARACYRVQISAHRVPPLPVVSIDLLTGRIIYPLKRITKVTVDLQSVDFGPRDGPPNLLSRP